MIMNQERNINKSNIKERITVTNVESLRKKHNED